MPSSVPGEPSHEPRWLEPNRAGSFGGGSTELEPKIEQRAIVIVEQRRALLLIDLRDRAITADRFDPVMRLAVDA